MFQCPHISHIFKMLKVKYCELEHSKSCHYVNVRMKELTYLGYSLSIVCNKLLIQNAAAYTVG